jgi:hypothetical protein
MNIDPNNISSGLSWGTRGFRIGKSSYGNWWISIGFPFGFRYTWRLGRSLLPKQPEQIVNESKSQERKVLIDNSQSSEHKTQNQEIIEKMNRSE